MSNIGRLTAYPDGKPNKEFRNVDLADPIAQIKLILLNGRII